MIKDIVGGLILLAIAIAYYLLASDIPKSALADSVGPSGVPKAFAIMLGGLSILLLIKAGFVQIRAYQQGGVHLTVDPALLRSVLRMLGMLGLGIAYVVAVPWLGYVPTLALTLIAVILYQGKPFSWQVVLTGVIGAGVFWLLFVLVLGIPLPAGIWANWL